MSNNNDKNNVKNSNNYCDDLRRVTVNMINVWQTIELLAGNDLRRKLTPYEGYHDSSDILKNFKPAAVIRCDSFSGHNNNSNNSNNGQSSAGTDDNNNNNGGGIVQTFGTGGVTCLEPGISRNRRRFSLIPSKRAIDLQNELMKMRISRKQRAKHFKELKEITCEFDKLPEEYGDLVECSYSIPKISARIEKLMGTNVIRLTDRKYMKELRQRIEEDYQCELAKRIEIRKCQELDRERNLILEGKCDIVPDALAEHPIFIVNKKTNALIAKRRTKLKTSRARNAEQLIKQGIKWERERLYYEQLEKEKEDDIKERKFNHKLLEEQFKMEDAERGLDLIRIHDENWRECEKGLEEYLTKERNKMKSRSMKIPQRPITDKLDIEYMIRARRDFREAQIKQQEKQAQDQFYLDQQNELIETDNKDGDGTTFVRTRLPSLRTYLANLDPTTNENVFIFDDDDIGPSSEQMASNKSGSDSDNVILSQKDSESIVGSSAYLRDLNQAIDDDTDNGLIMSKELYAAMHYVDPKVARLKLTDTINGLYALAEEIILNLEDIEDEEMGEEEFGEESDFFNL